MIRVILVDDHALVRQGFHRIIEEEPGMSVVGEAGTAQDGVALARQAKPDVVLMDLDMPVLDGIEATRRILAAQPQTAIIALTAFSDRPRITGAMEAGACGYLLKDVDADEVAAIDAAGAGMHTRTFVRLNPL